MKFLLRIYHFLGSIFFAIFLLAVVALFVIAGTLVESKTESHRYAAYFTYNNPLFKALLWGFFINILISALRRWPFKKHHIPFLITHLGLLMILGGALIKSYYGLQGAMGIMEGSSSHTIFVPDTYAIYLEKKDPKNPLKIVSESFPLERNWLGRHQSRIPTNAPFADVQLYLESYTPHAKEALDTWISTVGTINGLNPFQAYDWTDPSNIDKLPVSTRVRLHHSQSDPWDLFAGITKNVPALAERAYIQGMSITLSDAISQKIYFQGLLDAALKKPIAFDDMTISTSLDFDNSTLIVKIDKMNQPQKIFSIPLQGQDSVLISYQEHTPIVIDLKRVPALLFLKDTENTHVFAFDPHGRVFNATYPQDKLQSMIAYDRGFGGYAVQFKLPFPSYPNGRIEREKATYDQLAVQLQESLKSRPQLAPPLHMLKEACENAKVDFVSCCLTFLSSWDAGRTWLYPETMPLTQQLSEAIQALDWNKISASELQASLWAKALCDDLEPSCRKGKNLITVLQERKWPLQSRLNTIPQNNYDQFSILAQQLFSIASQLPPLEMPQMQSVSTQARLLSAYLLAYGIHWRNLIKGMPHQEIAMEEVVLETTIKPRHQEEKPSKKLEENIPKIVLQIRRGSKLEKISLIYDPFGQGLKWPILNGEYVVRFQPQFIQIPYQVRLRQARQINYAHSTQPFSFESDLIFTDNKQHAIEKTISMNNVHETWEGHRFYLANISQPHEMAAKRVQIIVNYDPAKYWLTYPGSILLTIGIVLLFWLNPYKKR